MSDDLPMPYTLAIADCQMDLQVIGFTGLDALNEIYRFEVDLISRDPHLDFTRWLGRDAFLALGPDDCGVHGQIFHAVQPYAGTCLSHYRVSLMPRVQMLAQRRQRRIFHDLTAPELIEQLLHEHGIKARAYRFDRLVGLYPRQPLRLQYGETDLHLLQRVCEEEGIHFRFEHSLDHHRLVFADDPASFCENPLPLRFRPGHTPNACTASLSHLAERWAATPGPHEHPGTAGKQLVEQPAATRPLDPQGALGRQRSIRQLERMRCARRQINGRSNQSMLRSGQVLQVLDHPEALFNDQWLLTRIQHTGRQLAILESFDPHDIAAIIETSQVNDAALPLSGQSYANGFDVLPWAMPFRPALKRAKPSAAEPEYATLIGAEPDEQGRLPIRFDWQPDLARRNPPAWPLAHVLDRSDEALQRMRSGSRVRVNHLDNDPARPVICGVLDDDEDTGRPRLHLDGLPIDNVRQPLKLKAGQRLHIEASQGMALHGELGRLEMTAQWISIHGPRAVQASQMVEDQDGPLRKLTLRLLDKPGPQGLPLAHCRWYIVRMLRPGLEHLARLAPEHFLFEGETDAEGFLGLPSEQIRRLALEYNRTPDALCLVYPGQCMALRSWLEQHLSEAALGAFIVSGL